ncbi:hypothetical protein C0583_00785 [Candidatus Parcubacteria bacterium]|nr:MAG: hypothetical protein C0583_00785 [Candidatus Parcubacteria bacterium]
MKIINKNRIPHFKLALFLSLLIYITFTPFLPVLAAYCGTPRGPETNWTQLTCEAAGYTWDTGDPDSSDDSSDNTSNEDNGSSLPDSADVTSDTSNESNDSSNQNNNNQINTYCNINGTVFALNKEDCDKKKAELANQANNSSGGNTSSSFIPKADTSSIAKYIKSIYQYAIGVVGIIATVIIMINGLIWITSMGNASRISGAKDWIIAALTGLALAMFSYTLLWIVNPDLVKFKDLNLEKVNAIGDDKELGYYDIHPPTETDRKCKNSDSCPSQMYCDPVKKVCMDTTH